MKSRMPLKSVLFLAVWVALPAAGPPVLASSTGISGFSGNPATGGFICTACHAGGIAPVVTITGPTLVKPGSVTTYLLTISGGQRVAGGLDVSAPSGTLLVADPGTRLLNREVTHTQPRLVDSRGAVSWTFNWQAPLAEGAAILYAAGNSVNRNFLSTGDFPAKTSLSVMVAQEMPVAGPGEASGDGLDLLRVTALDPLSGDLSLAYGPACGSTDHVVYFGPLERVREYLYTGASCALGVSGQVSGFNPGPGSFFFVVVGARDATEGSYGTSRGADGLVLERPPSLANYCGPVQDLTARCD